MSDQSANILVVDDDAPLLELLQSYLTSQGFKVHGLPTATDIERELERDAYDLVVLDLMLPVRDGLSACQALRQAGNTVPIIMLTAKGGDNDRIHGLDLGADDYMAKPFNPRELVSRIHAVLRRHEITRQKAESEDEVFAFGPYTLNIDTRQLKRGDEFLPLRTSEFDLLRIFIKHRNKTLSRDQIMELTRGADCDAFDRSVDVQISRLRRLIEPNPSHPVYIQTVWGLGYAFYPKGAPA